MELYTYNELLLRYVNYTSKFLFKIRKYSENFSMGHTLLQQGLSLRANHTRKLCNCYS